MKINFSNTTLAALILWSINSNALTPSLRCVHTNLAKHGESSVMKTTRINLSSQSNENMLRQEIVDKSTLVDAKDELNYDSSIGKIVNGGSGNISSEQQIESQEISYPKDFLKKLDRATKPRAYPLFIAEKAAILVEDFLHSISRGGNNEELELSSDGAATKEKIVILGTGWGSAAFLKEIDTSKFDITVISPRNFFLFTPMLAGASVGTVEYRSITENIRDLNSKANYLEGTATDIDIKSNTVHCESVVCEGNSCVINDFSVEYDKLVVAVGAQTNTFGIPGVREYCCFLKQVEDARRIRNAIVNCFERANLPDLTEEQRIATLTFAVIGAGPTGVEFASELRDFVEQDGPKYYPNLLKYVRIKVIEASPTILAPFDKSLQNEAIKQLTRDINTKDPKILNLLPERFKLTELLLNSGVAEVKEDTICLNDGKQIPYGLAVWAAGNGPLPLTLQLIQSIGEEENKPAVAGLSQTDGQDIARGRIAIDPWLRCLGGEGKILSFGDCSCLTTNQLPATAQVASQQGEYLARLLSQGYDFEAMGNDEQIKNKILYPPRPDPSRQKSVAEKITSFACQSDEMAAPFQFLNLGILAYTGDGSALAQLQLDPTEKGRVKSKGKIGFGLWRSVYLSKQVSWKNRILVFVDWTKAQVFGRDITRID
mmetsp:Transcript_15989/g.22782  ORF Transcript_15989/g.22782 Transcript_15989/m.22782 type:complete len:658 (-) Transcript_15989:363-2336(-)|eukprot:CAMPEP_0184864768 /NCGR_PEP_ID=MMETSP0580-20130426/16067_1 /TAXON_ID=1118495 /ORGANISM="Dactyliosolen fragilissimus" /LENGTH=657 /DNA_ID=CAMNT_0027363687 /DNA_START=67 /DNA_END=2040 /DNA_ORIENTATION=+